MVVDINGWNYFTETKPEEICLEDEEFFFKETITSERQVTGKDIIVSQVEGTVYIFKLSM